MSQIAAIFPLKAVPGECSLLLAPKPLALNAYEVLNLLVPKAPPFEEVQFVLREDLDKFYSLQKSLETLRTVLIPASLFVVKQTSLKRPYGIITYTPIKLRSPSITFIANNSIPRCTKENAWPINGEESEFFNREALTTVPPIAGESVFVSHWDNSFDTSALRNARSIWTAGVATWKKLLAKDIFVTGCVDGLGMQELQYLPESLKPTDITILTHNHAPDRQGFKTVHMYKLVSISNDISLYGKTHFYWKSGSLYRHLTALHPEIKEHFHSCGPGETYEMLRSEIPQERIQVFLSLDDWKKEIIHESEAAAKKQVFETHP